MSSTVILLLGLVPAAVFVMWPLFWASDDETIAPRLADNADALQGAKIAALAAIKEAEFDQRTGKLSDEDYAALIARYKAQALEAMAALEEQGAAARTAAPQPATGGATGMKFCPSCGTKIAAGGKFCSGCGRGVG